MTPHRVPGPAGVGTDLRAVKAYVPLSKWAEVTERAQKAGLTVSAYLKALIDRDTLDSDGRPDWAPRQDSHQEEIRISA